MEPMYEKIKEMMKENGIKYDNELERLAGVKAGTIRNIKNGHTPAPETLLKIAEVLKTTVAYLVSYDGEAYERINEDESLAEYVRFTEKMLIEFGNLSPENP